MRYRGLLYRALNPVYAAEPLSGEGARRFGGRFNAKGVPSLYTSLSPHTALRESAQVGTLQPTVLLAYEADVEPVFDARDEASLAERGTTLEVLAADDWRARMLDGTLAPTQRFARSLVEDGFAALLVPSFARGACEGDDNLVLYAWGGSSNRLRPIDDEERLRRAGIASAGDPSDTVPVN